MRSTEDRDRSLAAALAVALAAAVALTIACQRPSPAAQDADASPAEVGAVADALWDYLLERDLWLRITNGLPVEELPRVSLEEDTADAAYFAALLERLELIDPERLPHEDYLTLRVLQTDLAMSVEAVEFYWNRLSLSPYLSLYTWSEVGNVFESFRFEGPEDLERYRKLLDDYVLLLADHLAKLRGQAARGIRLPRAVIPGTVAMLEGFRDQFAALRTVAPERLERFDTETRTGFQTEVDAGVDAVLAGYDLLLEALGGDYADLAPEAVGAYQYERGRDYYRHSVRYFTSTDFEPREIHELGLRRVAELDGQMAAIREEVGFTGTREAFHRKLRTDPRFLAADAAEVERRYRTYIERMEARLDDYFELRPEAPYGVRRLSPAEEVNSTWGYYKPPDSIDPAGIYNYNASNLEERSLVSAASLIFHELLPGHHFQVALQLENESLHPYRRNAYSGAFTEGWAEYAAGLGGEMGLYDDPYDRYGQLIMEIFLAARLVVDTGIGDLGWSLDEARAYLREHTFQSDTQIATETLRYATRPGQALAYRLGLETFRDLRARAEAALGDRFSVRAFHATVLESGALPLAVLEEHVDWWIEGRLESAAF